MAHHTTFWLVFLLFANTASAEYVLSAPPREKPAEAERVYGPLAAELSRITGDKVVFNAPKSWAAYGHDMQEGKYDLVIDGPHFVAWRMAHIGHQPLVRFDGDLSYTVYTSKDGPAKLSDLRFKKVCAMASPNLGTAVLLAEFDAYSPPEIVAPSGGVKGSFAAFEQGRCVAVVLPSFVSERLPQEKLAGLKELFASSRLPNVALSAGPRVIAEHRAAIIKALSAEKLPDKLKTLSEYLAGTGSGVFIPATAGDYSGNEKFLENVVWGW